MRLDWPEPADRRGQSVADLPVAAGDSPRPGAGRPADVPSVTDYRATVDEVYRKYAIDQGCARVREIEENVTTPAMRRIESEDPDRHLVGLEHRLKGEDRLTEKVTKIMNERGHSAQEAFGLVKDAIRYTFQYPDDRYTEGVRADCARLRDSGFEPVDLANSWDKPQYKGINSRWQDPASGQLFEVQFHTRASFEAKEETHAAYEKLRVGVPSMTEQRQLEQFQREVSTRIPVPRGAPDIQNYP